MYKYFFPFLLLCVGMPALAQLSGDGYYRVKNYKSERYIRMIDNKSKGGNISTTTYDLDALMTVKPFSLIDADAGTVVYIENCGDNQYNLKAQGTDAYQTVGRYLTLTQASASQQTYFASATESGITVYLYDEQYQGAVGRLMTSSKTGGGSDFYRHWRFLPVSASDDNNYFGVEGTVKASNQYFTAFYSYFPYTFASSGMKAYIVTKVDGDLAVWKPLEGKVAGSTPVIISCAAADASSNRLNLEIQDGVKPEGNLLQGVFFNNTDVDYIDESSFHFNANKYDPATMRLLGTTSDGKLGFVKSGLKYIPRNSSYLTVAAGAPDEITLVTQEVFDAIVAADVVTVTAQNYTRPYGDPNPSFEYSVEGTLKGQPTVSCSATQSSPVGTYPIVVGKGTVTNRTFNAVNGTLTIEKAPLTVTARSYTIKQNEPLPQYACDYDGFKLGQTESVLSAMPVIACDVPEDKAPGTYTITVSGATAQNYDITFTAGTLTILEADPIIVTATSLTKEYGDIMPKLSWTIEGGNLQGQPELLCEVTETTLPGIYPITVSSGTLDYPNLVFVNGTVTVTKAPLTISAGNYTMKQTDERPEFNAIYTGFKLGETEEVLTQQPVFTTSAPDDNAPGEYEVEVSGAEAANYVITYKSGRLIITEANQILLMVADATIEYGEDLPPFFYVVSGGSIDGEPVITCEATHNSPVGTYPIVIELGTITYPNVKLVNGTLTIIKAPLTAFVADYEREQGQPNPDFEVIYSGFRNGDDASVLKEAPVATTTATAESLPGIYDIIVSGGEAENYFFNYAGGKLTVTVIDAVASLKVSDTPVDIYTVTGRLVRSQATTLKGLPRGLYIVNGRKVVIR